MKLYYSIAAGWLIAAPGAVNAQVDEPPSSNQDVAYADVALSTPERRILDAAPNFKDCRDWAGLLTEERPKQARTFEVCSADGDPDSVLNSDGIVRAGSLVERDGSLFLEPAQSDAQAASSGGTLVAGPIPQGTTIGTTQTTIDVTSASPVDYNTPPFSASPSGGGVPGYVGVPSHTPTTVVSAPSGPSTGNTGGTTTVVAGPTPGVTAGPTPAVSPGATGGTTIAVGGGSSGLHPNNGFGNGGADGIPGKSAKPDVAR
jgi:hypothetical protein